MEELKGFDFRIFWVIAVNRRTATLQQLNSIKLHPSEHQSSKVQDSIETLMNKNYIIETREKEYRLTEKGDDFYKNYSNDLDEIIFDEIFDIAAMKFLYDMEGPVPWVMLPYCIGKCVPQFGKGMEISFFYKTYFQDDSKFNDKFLVNDKYISLNKEGKRYYEHRIRKKAEEKAKNEKESKIRELDYTDKIRKDGDYVSMKRQRNISFVINIGLLIATVAAIFIKCN